MVDTDEGVLHRRAAGEAKTRKRTPAAPILRPLLAHLRRWERRGARFVVEVEGQRVGGLKTAWHTAVMRAMQRDADKWTAVDSFGLSLDKLELVYGHHHPDRLLTTVEALERKA